MAKAALYVLSCSTIIFLHKLCCQTAMHEIIVYAAAAAATRRILLVDSWAVAAAGQRQREEDDEEKAGLVLNLERPLPVLPVEASTPGPAAGPSLSVIIHG